MPKACRSRRLSGLGPGGRPPTSLGGRTVAPTEAAASVVVVNDSRVCTLADPAAAINDQHSQHTDNRNCQRDIRGQRSARLTRFFA